MANREENLKKINFELEQMSDEELENVVGGTYIDILNVANFLFQAGFNDTLNEKGFVDFAGMSSALNSIGISVEDHGGAKALGGTSNTYTVTATGQTMNQSEMMNFLRDKYPNVRYKDMVEPQNLGDVLTLIK